MDRLSRLNTQTHVSGGEEFFLKKFRGRRLFLLQNLKIQDFIFQKAIFEDQKVIKVGSSYSSVLIGV